jgi:hypothetical protein
MGVVTRHPEEELPLVSQNRCERRDLVVVREVSCERAELRGNGVSDMFGTDGDLERFREWESSYETFRIAVRFDKA